VGEVVELAGNGGTGRGYLARPELGAGLGVLVIQEWWGLVPHIEDVCDRFAAEGFTALAPDLYDGVTASEPDEAGKLMMALNLERAAGKLSGAVELPAS
jgi:carboxymethylenebutenolidase